MPTNPNLEAQLLQRAQSIGPDPQGLARTQIENQKVQEAGMPDWRQALARLVDRFASRGEVPIADEVSQLFERGIRRGTIPRSAPTTAVQTAEQALGRGPATHADVDALIQEMQNSAPFRGGQ